MPKFTTDQINTELAALEDTEAQAAVHYLRQELRRRRLAGRKAGKKVPDTVNERVRRHRSKREA